MRDGETTSTAILGSLPEKDLRVSSEESLAKPSDDACTGVDFQQQPATAVQREEEGAFAGQKRPNEEEHMTADDVDDDNKLTRPSSSAGLRVDSEGYLTTLGLSINPVLRYLVCSDCERAVLEAEVRTHLRSYHKETLPLLEPQKLRLAIGSTGVELSDDWVDPGAHIRDAYDGIEILVGYECPECPGSSFHAISTLRSHYRSKHPQTKFDRNQAFPRADMQQVTTAAGPARKFFPVIVRNTVLQDAGISDFVAQLERTQRLQFKSVTAQEQDLRRHPEWIQRLRYSEALKGRNDFPYLTGLTELPKDVGPPSRLLRAVREITEQANGLIPLTSELILRRLVTADPKKRRVRSDKHPSDVCNLNLFYLSGYEHAPFKRLQKGDHAYDNECYRVLLFLKRTRKSERPTYDSHIPDDIACLVEEMNDALMAPNATYSPAQVKETVLALLVAIYTRTWEPSENNAIPDPVMQTVMLTMLDRDGRWKDAKDLTPTLARLERNVRTVMLVHMHRLRKSLPGSPSLDEISLLLQKSYTEGYHSTFSALIQTQHLASSIAMSQPSAPTMYWVDPDSRRILNYNGWNIHVDDWARMMHALHDRQDVVLKELLMGEEDILIDFTGKTLVDNPQQQSYCYSLFKDGRNSSLFYPDGNENILLHRVASRPALRRKFFRQSADGEWHVLSTVARQWMGKLAELSGLNMSALTLAGGGPARSTELTALNYACGRDGDMRNLVVYRNGLVIAKTYHKMGPTTGQLKLIPDILDAHLSYVLLHELAILRPFAIMLAQTVFPNNETILEKYRCRLFLSYGREFKCDDLSNLLAIWTSQYLKVSMTLRFVRQAMIAFKNAKEDSTDVDAFMASHSSAVEFKRYAVLSELPTGGSSKLWDECRVACRLMHIRFEIIPGEFARS
ncbi:unnamed protein product [Peniophora sp. CBMAI 1063]|nr:unnamed protein product [Peniophora sp. CBMAI 1063]